MLLSDWLETRIPKDDMDKGQLAWMKTWLMKNWLLFWRVAGTKLLKSIRFGVYFQKFDKFRGSAHSCAVRGKLWSVIITACFFVLYKFSHLLFLIHTALCLVVSSDWNIDSGMQIDRACYYPVSATPSHHAVWSWSLTVVMYVIRCRWTGLWHCSAELFSCGGSTLSDWHASCSSRCEPLYHAIIITGKSWLCPALFQLMSSHTICWLINRLTGHIIH